MSQCLDALPQWKFPNSHSTVQEIRPKYQLVSKTERDHYRKHYLQPEMWVMCGRAIKLFCDLVSIDSTHVLQGYCTGTTENKPFIIMFWATPAVGVESCLKFRGSLFETTLQLMMQQFAYNWYLPLYTNTHTNRKFEWLLDLALAPLRVPLWWAKMVVSLLGWRIHKE